MRLAAACIALGASAWLPASRAAADPSAASAAPAGAEGGVFVPVPHSDAALSPLAAGVQLWLGQALADLALFPSLGDTTTADALAEQKQAETEGASVVLRARLARRGDDVEIALALARAGGAAPIRAARRRGPTSQIGESLRAAFEHILPGLGALSRSEPLPAPPSIEELAVVSRARARLAGGDAGAAWKELDGSLWPSAIRQREELEAQARSGAFAPFARARVLAGIGDRPAAWQALDLPLAAAAPEAPALAAAAELALAENNPKRAEFLANAALALNASAACTGSAAVVLGQIHARRGNAEQAQAHFARAAELLPDDPSPLLLEAELSPANDAARAPLLLRAGQRAAKRLDA
jgi:tetratricopeptide (TPR) repeat protein